MAQVYVYKVFCYLSLVIILTVLSIPIIDESYSTIDNNDEDASKYYNKGNDLRDEKNYEEAIVQYDKALEIDPEKKEAYNNKGMALEKLERYGEAIVQYDKAIELEPNDKNTYNNKGNTLRELERYGEAIVQYDKALEIDPDYKKALDNKEEAISLMDSSSTNSERSESASSIEKEIPDIGTKSPFGSADESTGSFAKSSPASSSSQSGDTIDPDYKKALDNKEEAISLMDSSSTNSERSESASSIEKEIPDIGTKSPFGSADESTGSFAKSSPASSSSQSDDTTVSDSFSPVATTNNDTTQPFPTGNMMINTNSTEISNNGTNEEAEQFWESGNDYRFDNLDYELALAEYDKAITLDNSDSTYHRSKADVLSNLERYEEAVVEYDRALELAKPNNFWTPDIYDGKAYALYKLGKYAEAIQVIDTGIQISPDVLYSEKADLLSFMGRHTESIQALDKAIELDPTNAYLYRDKAAQYSKTGDYEQAIVEYNNAIVLDPYTHSDYLEKGNALYNLGRYQEAIDAFDKTLELYPENYLAVQNKDKANALLQSEQEKDAQPSEPKGPLDQITNSLGNLFGFMK